MNVPWWAKILIGIGAIAILYWLFDLWEMLIVFANIVFVPLIFLVSLDLVSQGTYEAISNTDWLTKPTRDLREKVDNWRRTLAESKPQPPEAEAL